MDREDMFNGVRSMVCSPGSAFSINELFSTLDL